MRNENYVTQGASMIKKFEEKGYPSELVQEAFLSHMNPLPKQKAITKENDNMVRFVSTFNDKYRSVFKIIKKITKYYY